ncbi:MAG: ABC transporter ATP-binding protein [Hyphomicrobiaceae bacterium]
MQDGTAEPVVHFEDLTLGYDDHPAVHHLEGVVGAGALLAVVGPNGSGKSTLLKGIIGALKPLEGRIGMDGALRRRIAYLPQQAQVDRSFPITVEAFVALGLWKEIGAFRGLDTRARSRIRKALMAVGLEGFERRMIDALSGGQMQRILFARLLLEDSALILLDEPFTAIDTKTAAELMALIERWHGERRTIIAVLHDLDLVKERFPQALMLAREPVAWGDTRSVITPENLLKARAMSEAWDENAPWCRKSAA